MNETTSIVVAALVFMGLGVGLSLLGVFCYFMLRMMKGLQESAELATEALQNTAKLAIELRDELRHTIKEAVGPNSALTRGANATTKLVNALPEIMGGLEAFSKTMEVFYATAFDKNSPPLRARNGRKPKPEAEPEDPFTGMIPYSEEVAAQYEQDREHVKQRMPVTEQQLSMMVTDSVKEIRLPAEAPTEPPADV